MYSCKNTEVIIRLFVNIYYAIASVVMLHRLLSIVSLMFLLSSARHECPLVDPRTYWTVQVNVTLEWYCICDRI